MTTRAIVLSGGGAKIGYHAGALSELQARGLLDHAETVAGAGVSAGALAIPFAMAGRPELLEQLVMETRESSIHRRFSKAGMAWMLIRGRLESIADNRPLLAMIQRWITPLLSEIPHRRQTFVGHVRFDGACPYVAVPLTAPDIERAIWASCTIPGLWKPVPMDGYAAVDGGLRTQIPLDDVLPLDVDEIICVSLNPATLTEDGPTPWIVPTLARTLSIITQQVALDDVAPAIRINRIVEQASSQGATIIRRSTGQPYRYQRILVVRPQLGLGDTLDFTATTQAQRIQQGRRDMAAALDAW